jgi:hypothetical protein
MVNARQAGARFVRLTQEIFREVVHKDRPGQNRDTTRKINEALRLADRLVREEPADANLAECRARLRRMKRRRSQ